LGSTHRPGCSSSRRGWWIAAREERLRRRARELGGRGFGGGRRGGSAEEASEAEGGGSAEEAFEEGGRRRRGKERKGKSSQLFLQTVGRGGQLVHLFRLLSLPGGVLKSLYSDPCTRLSSRCARFLLPCRITCYLPFDATPTLAALRFPGSFPVPKLLLDPKLLPDSWLFTWSWLLRCAHPGVVARRRRL
jgi:hypothetical protein